VKVPIVESRSDLICIGKITKTHGLRGEVFLALVGSDPSCVRTACHLSVGPDARAVKTYEVEAVSPHKNGLILHFAGLTSIEKAEEIKGLSAFIEAKKLATQKGKSHYLFEVLGFSIEDLNGDVRGVIKDFQNGPFQDLAVVESAKGETFLVPYSAASVRSIDRTARRLFMDVAEGLEALNP